MKTSELSPKALAQIQTAVGKTIDERIHLLLLSIRDEISSFYTHYENQNDEQDAALRVKHNRHREYESSESERFMNDVMTYLQRGIIEKKPDASAIGRLFDNIEKNYHETDKKW